MSFFKFLAVALLITSLHAAVSIAVNFLVEADSFPYGMQRSQGSVYLGTLKFAQWFLGLPLQSFHTSRHPMWTLSINSTLFATLLTSMLFAYRWARRKLRARRDELE